MGGKIEHDFTVEHWRKGVSGFDVIVSSTNLVIARAAFWATVDAKSAAMFAGDELLLRHGARVILRYPPEVGRSPVRI